MMLQQPNATVELARERRALWRAVRVTASPSCTEACRARSARLGFSRLLALPSRAWPTRAQMPYGVLGLAAVPPGLLNAGAAISIDVSGADAKHQAADRDPALERCQVEASGPAQPRI